jgi:uncharacterized SAM-binding protein YcdF (DUF218 family)
MKRASKLLIGFAGAGLAVFAAGFVVFADAVTGDAASTSTRADGIVVLTGGPERIAEAARLLRAGQAGRLLISGVNHNTSREDLRRLAGLDRPLFECCVDIGYAAQDTTGNAEETRAWSEKWRFSSLTVVTANYHMPRALAELGRLMPQARLLPYAVVPKRMTEQWWRDTGTARLLLEEYVKFLPAALRFGLARLVRQTVGSSPSAPRVAPRSASGAPRSC